MAIEDLNPVSNQIPKKKKRKPNPGFSVTPGMEVPVPIKLDKWHSINNPPARRKKVNPANTTQVVFVDFSVPTLPTVNIDQWLSNFAVPPRKKPFVKPSEYATSQIAAINPDNGNYFDSGVIGLTITVISDESSEWADTGVIGFTITAVHTEDFQLEDIGEISFTIKYPDVGVEIFNSGVPGFISANVIIDGANESNFIQGVISVTREDNTAARFSLSLEEDPDEPLPRKPIEFINKIVSIAFAAADMDGIVADYIPVFTGIIKGVVFNDDTRTFNLSGYDYSGIHQTKGEYISENITTILTGSIGANGSGTKSTGKSPIWGVVFNGNNSVEDGRDYFVDTKNGTIVVPISSNILQFPGSFTYSYAQLFSNMKAIIQTIVDLKNWNLQEDRVSIVNYTNQKNQPVLSLSDESVIDACRKFLELTGAKLEGNLFPDLRVYSEVANWVSSSNVITVDESEIFENSLVYNIDFDDLLNEQTVRSVQKVHAEIVISGSEALGTFSGSQGSVNPFTIQGGNNIDNIDYNTPLVLAEHRVNKRNIFSLSFSSSGTFSLFWPWNPYSAPITGSSWNWFIDGDDIVIQLKHTVVTAGGRQPGSGIQTTGITITAYPAIDYQLTVNGTKISYSGNTPEDVRVVTAQRPISGITETLKGDVYENPYIETDAHCVNICNAILLERGNPYGTQFEIPVFVGKDANIGDRLDIKRDGNIIYSGIIKRLNYSINLEQGQNRILVGVKGIGRGM
jgi:hypothetical protein